MNYLKINILSLLSLLMGFTCFAGNKYESKIASLANEKWWGWDGRIRFTYAF